MMRLGKIVCLLILLAVPRGAKDEGRPFRDFSTKGPEYRLLDGLRLAVPDVAYEGTEAVEILGKHCVAAKYTTTVEVEVQTMCAVGPGGGHQANARCPAIYEILAIEDKDRGLHDGMINTLYGIWSRKELCTEDYCMDFKMQSGEYVVSTCPATDLKDSSYQFWVHGRLFKIIFKGFQSGGGWGPLSCFNTSVLRIRLGDKDVSAYQTPLHVQKDFLRLYQKGFFGNAPDGWLRVSGQNALLRSSFNAVLSPPDSERQARK